MNPVAVVLIVFGIIIVLGVIGETSKVKKMPPAERGAYLAEQRRKREARGTQRISTAGDTTTGVLACPKCKGTQFKAKRRGAAKIASAPMLIAMPFIPKTRVKCVTCGTEYLRS